MFHTAVILHATSNRAAMGLTLHPVATLSLGMTALPKIQDSAAETAAATTSGRRSQTAAREEKSVRKFFESFLSSL